MCDAFVASQDTGLAIRGARACSLRLTGPPLPPVALPQQPAASESDSGAQSAQLTIVHSALRRSSRRFTLHAGQLLELE